MMQILKYVLLVGIAFVAVVPSTSGQDYNVTKREHFPYEVSLRFQGKHVCGGAIYSKKYILTAASCVNNTKPAQWEVVSGTLNLQTKPTNNTQTLLVDKFYIPKNYTSTFIQSNIAIIKLSKDLKFDNFTKSVPIARKWSAAETQKCIVTGWGANGTLMTKTLDLHAANVTILTDNQCMYYKNYAPKVMTCAGLNFGNNPCTGDLGGPLVCNNTLYGVVSWRDQCNVNGRPGVYTNVTYFDSWITSKSGTSGADAAKVANIHYAILFSVFVCVFNALKY